MILITELFSITLGQMVTALTPSSFVSALLNPFIIIVLALLCGLTIPKVEIPHFWRAWLYQLDPTTHRRHGGHGAARIVCNLHNRGL
jgi:ATP-binding cassette subfamily G (WHITE) protein 2 (SNQ2)